MDPRAQLQTSLGSNYTVERELGGGGMSRVFLARDVALDRGVVVKLLSAETTTGVSADRFRREIQVIARLQHPHVVPILSAGASDAGLYYVMPFLSGETLRARIAREGPLPAALAARIMREVLDALAFAHAHGVIHRDIKPENILLEAGHAVVADFGVAKALHESSSMTSVGVALGTPAYMAPEQAAADNATDHRADLYAVGVVAYEMITGRPPFEGSPAQVIRAHMTESPTPILQRRSDVPEAMAALIMRALEKEPRDRPASAQEMLATLEAVTTPGTTEARPGTRAPVPGNRDRAQRKGWAVAMVVLVIAGAGAWAAFGRAPVSKSAQSIAIAPFAVSSGDTALTRMGQNLVTTVGANLDGIGPIRVADGIAVLSHARSRGGILSADDARTIAQKVGARSVVYGTLVQQGRTVRADAGLYEVGNTEPVARLSVTVPNDSLAALTDSLTWGLLRAVWQRGKAPTPTVTAITTRSTVALREFLEGDRLWARGRLQEAAEAYKRAVNADTTFWFAHFRHRYARAWYGLAADTAIVARLRRHRDELPERERALVTIMDSVMSVTERVHANRALVARYPDYVPAWVAHGDYLIHHAMRAGFSVREAIEPWQQAVRLVPEDLESASHWVIACIAAGDPCADTAFTNFDRVIRSDSGAGRMQHALHQTLLTIFRPSKGLTDSLIRASVSDTTGAFVGGTALPIFVPATVDRPELFASWDNLKRDQLRRRTSPTMTRVVEGFDAVARGDWSRIDETVRAAPELTVPVSQFHPIAAVRTRALGELQEMIAPDPRTAATALEYVKGPNPGANRLMDAEWTAGINELLRGDTIALHTRLTRLDRDTTAHAGIARRSLRAIALGRSGQRAAAAESLLVLERVHGEKVPKVWGAFAADRLLGAEWLAEQRRYEPADSLLRFTEGYLLLGTYEAANAILPTAYLVRSRIAEGLGDREAAVRFATMFLRVFDRGPASKKAWVDEANARVARLTPSDAKR